MSKKQLSSSNEAHQRKLEAARERRDQYAEEARLLAVGGDCAAAFERLALASFVDGKVAAHLDAIHRTQPSPSLYPTVKLITKTCARKRRK